MTLISNEDNRRSNVKSMKSNTECNPRLNNYSGFNNENCLFENRNCQIYTYNWYLDDIYHQARNNYRSLLSIMRFALCGLYQVNSCSSSGISHEPLKLTLESLLIKLVC